MARYRINPCECGNKDIDIFWNKEGYTAKCPACKKQIYHEYQKKKDAIDDWNVIAEFHLVKTNTKVCKKCKWHQGLNGGCGMCCMYSAFNPHKTRVIKHVATDINQKYYDPKYCARYEEGKQAVYNDWGDNLTTYKAATREQIRRFGDT